MRTKRILHLFAEVLLCCKIQVECLCVRLDRARLAKIWVLSMGNGSDVCPGWGERWPCYSDKICITMSMLSLCGFRVFCSGEYLYIIWRKTCVYGAMRRTLYNKIGYTFCRFHRIDHKNRAVYFSVCVLAWYRYIYSTYKLCWLNRPILFHWIHKYNLDNSDLWLFGCVPIIIYG